MPIQRLIIFLILYCNNEASSMALLKSAKSSISDPFNNGIIQILRTNISPSENDVPKMINNIDNNATYILSKLSDDMLLQMLNQQPKQKEYNFNDVIKVINQSNAKENKLNTKFKSYSVEPYEAVFRLDDKEVKPFNFNDDADRKYTAFQKLNNILYSRPQDQISEEVDRQKETLFNVLVDQLKSLCCKKHKRDYLNNNDNYIQYLKNTLKNPTLSSSQAQFEERSKEQLLFLIVNDEIKSNNVSEEIILVDPDTLSKNSSVLLLGPLTTPLPDHQLKYVMSRIGNELSKPEYLPLLQRISKGIVDETNYAIMNSILTAPNSRRYIKPHRCNHQSKLAKIHVGPKWLICTGYLNLNIPSLYD